MRTLLIIDDDPAWRALYRLVFEDRFRVLEARDGQEGLEQYEETSPDLVIVDLRMPRMDGATFLVKLREKDHGAPVVVCTAVAREAMSLVGPGVRVVPKSPGLKELLDVISSLDLGRPGWCGAEAGKESRD